MDGHSGHTSTTILILHPEPLVGVMLEELLSEASAGKTLYVGGHLPHKTAIDPASVFSAAMTNSMVCWIADSTRSADLVRSRTKDAGRGRLSKLRQRRQDYAIRTHAEAKVGSSVRL